MPPNMLINILVFLSYYYASSNKQLVYAHVETRT
jgi:hypothetical protein